LTHRRSWRRGRDSNPRTPFGMLLTFQASAFDHSATSPTTGRKGTGGGTGDQILGYWGTPRRRIDRCWLRGRYDRGYGAIGRRRIGRDSLRRRAIGWCWGTYRRRIDRGWPRRQLERWCSATGRCSLARRWRRGRPDRWGRFIAGRLIQAGIGRTRRWRRRVDRGDDERPRDVRGIGAFRNLERCDTDRALVPLRFVAILRGRPEQTPVTAAQQHRYRKPNRNPAHGHAALSFMSIPAACIARRIKS
jgi:hypothetical protein